MNSIFLHLKSASELNTMCACGLKRVSIVMVLPNSYLHIFVDVSYFRSNINGRKSKLFLDFVFTA